MKRFRMPWSVKDQDSNPHLADSSAVDVGIESQPGDNISAENVSSEQLANEKIPEIKDDGLANVNSVENHLREFEALHEFDPNLPGWLLPSCSIQLANINYRGQAGLHCWRPGCS